MNEGRSAESLGGSSRDREPTVTLSDCLRAQVLWTSQSRTTALTLLLLFGMLGVPSSGSSQGLDVTGTWELEEYYGRRVTPTVVVMTQVLDSIVGLYASPELGESPIVGGLSNDSVFFSFSTVFGGQPGVATFRGAIENGQIVGDFDFIGFLRGRFRANRLPGSEGDSD